MTTYTTQQKAQMAREIHDATIGTTATLRGEGGAWDNTMATWVLLPAEGGVRYAKTMKAVREVIATSGECVRCGAPIRKHHGAVACDRFPTQK